jgi:uncharacterized protein (DUF302 family)
MHYFCKSVTMSFEDAVAATKQALKRHHFAILAEIDLRNAIRTHLAVDFRPYLILSTYSPQLAQRAIEADDKIGSILICNLVVQQKVDGGVEISAADPAATIGTINHIELVSVARELRSLLQRAIDDVRSFPEARRLLHDRVAGRQLAHAMP